MTMICNNCINPKKDKNLCTFNRTTDLDTKKVIEHCDYRIIATKPPVNLPVPRNTLQYIRTERKIGRNDPCPCRSGLKFKKCHGV